MVHIIVVAAGRGSRFGSELPKQFVQLGERPVLAHTLAALHKALPEARFTIVISPEFADLASKACDEAGVKLPDIVTGGASRAESVRNAIRSISSSGVSEDDVIMIHDGARPVVPIEMMHRISDAISGGAEAVIPVIPVTDSLRSSDGGAISLPYTGESRTADRSRMVAVQTPQAFRAGKIIEAYAEAFSPALTDDASVYQGRTGKAPELVEGSPMNIKITNPRDIDIAALYLGLK